jgi:ADP-heptose:LPS heptosyltransferase
MNGAILLHLASGVGNIVFSTPLLAALGELGYAVDVMLDADYPATQELLQPWILVRSFVRRIDCSIYDHILPAIPPFYWPRFARLYRGLPRVARRPPDSLFYRNEQEYYLAFARDLGFDVTRRTCYRLPVSPDEAYGIGSSTLVIAPGCKTGEMARKRWPYFPELAARFQDVALVGTSDDLLDASGKVFRFPGHVRSFVDQLTLRETAELIAAAGAVVGNDCGLCHIAGAVGTHVVILFGPTPHHTLGYFPTNVHVLRTGLPCEPCWFSKRFQACNARIDCMTQLGVDQVESVLRRLVGGRCSQ